MLTSGIGFSQNVLITGYVDATCAGADGRALEIYIDGTVDFTGYTLDKQSNGGGFTSSSGISELGTLTDEFAYITNDQTIFEGEFPNLNTSNTIENGSVSDNGNDGFQIADASGNVLDRFGVDGDDGAGEDWEHENSYYYRNDGSTSNAGNFDVNNWFIAPLGSLDDLGTCNGGDAFETVVPFGTFVPSASEEPQLIITSPFEDQEFTSNTSEITVSFTLDNFAISSGEDSNDGDGYIRYELGNLENFSEDGQVFSTDDFTLSNLMSGDYDLTLLLLDNNGEVTDPQVVDTVFFTILEGNSVNTIEDLRNGTLGDTYTLDSEVILTYKQDFRNQKYIEDGSAAILIDDPEGNFTTEYNRGDGISGITGELTEFNGLLQFKLLADAGAATSMGNTISPQVVTAFDLNSAPEDYESEYVVVEEAILNNAEIDTFDIGTLYDITAQGENFVFRTVFYEADYIGMDYPTGVLNLAGIITRDDTDGDGTAEYYLTSRDSEDLDVALANEEFIKKNLFSIYPNPSTNSRVYLNVEKGSQAEVNVYSILGQKVLSQKVKSGKQALNISSLSSGVYLVKVNQGAKTATRKLIVE